MSSIGMELLDCIIAGGLLLVLLSFLLRLLNKNENLEGLQELNEKPSKTPPKPVPNSKKGESDTPINLSQYPKQKAMDPPPSLKVDFSFNQIRYPSLCKFCESDFIYI